MIIRKASLEDSEEMLSIWSENLGSAPYNIPVDRPFALETLRQHVLDSDARVACDKDVIVGFAIASVYRYIDGFRLWVSELHVSTRHQGLGVGRALLERLEEDYRKNGVLCLELLSHSASSAAGFYRHVNYQGTAYQKLEKRLA